MKSNLTKPDVKKIGRFNLMVSSGSIRAILAGAGAGLACQMAHLDNFATIGGVSGGSIPSLLLAAKVDPKIILDKTLELDFAKVLPQRETVSHFLTSWLRPHAKKTYPYQGLRASAPLGELLESLVPVWPDNYWTVAARNGNPVLFTAKGVFEYQADKIVQIMAGRPSVSQAIRASCAIPGIIEAIDYAGVRLFDGGYSIHGGLPVELISRHFKFSMRSVLAVDFTCHEKMTFLASGLMYLSKFISHSLGRELGHIYREYAAAVIRPQLDWLTGRLPLSLTKEQKQEAIMAGFKEAYQVLQFKNLLPQESKNRLEYASRSFANLYEICSTKSEPVKTPWFQRMFSQAVAAVRTVQMR